MDNQVKLNPKEYGLDEQKVQSIEQAFLPKIQEREVLVSVFTDIISSELTPELCRRAKETRLKLVKVRTGIADIHKTQKAFYLAAGRFVDAWKNKETEPVEQMEDRLFEIENYYVNLEKERIAKLDAERKLECLEYTQEPVANLGTMDDFVYASYLKGLKDAFEAKVEAERKAKEEQAKLEEIKRLHEERKNMAIPYYQFWSEHEKMLNFGEQSQSDFDAFMSRNKSSKEKFDLEQKRIKEELAKANKAKEEAEAKAEAERKAKEEAERKAKAEEKARIEAERKAASAPDKEKLLSLIARFESVEIPELATEEASAIAANIKVLVGKITGYIKEKSEQL